MTIILSNLNRFKRFKIFFTGRFCNKLAVKWILIIPLHLAYVATLPCETLMPAKHAINNKLQGSVAIHLRRDCLVHFALLANTLLKDGESAQDNHVLACNFATYSPI